MTPTHLSQDVLAGPHVCPGLCPGDSARLSVLPHVTLGLCHHLSGSPLPPSPRLSSPGFSLSTSFPRAVPPPTLCFHRHHLSLWLEDTRLRVGLLLLLGDVPQGLWMRLAHSGDTEHVCSVNLEFSQELASGRWDEVWVVGSER